MLCCMRAIAVLTLACLAPLGASAQTCTASFESARGVLGKTGTLAWRETTMSDGKPLTLDFEERQGLLFIRFKKAGEGLWAEGIARLCTAGTELHVRLLPEDLAFGPAAGWFIRTAMGRGATFHLTMKGDGRLHVATQGWSGEFARDPR